jgi:hypothetical protein
MGWPWNKVEVKRKEILTPVNDAVYSGHIKRIVHFEFFCGECRVDCCGKSVVGAADVKAKNWHLPRLGRVRCANKRLFLFNFD